MSYCAVVVNIMQDFQKDQEKSGLLNCRYHHRRYEGDILLYEEEYVYHTT